MYQNSTDIDMSSDKCKIRYMMNVSHPQMKLNFVLKRNLKQSKSHCKIDSNIVVIC